MTTTKYSNTEVTTLTAFQKRALKMEQRRLLESLGSTPSEIIESLTRGYKCKFGMPGSTQGCIMEQFFRKTSLNGNSIFSTLDHHVKPHNAKAIHEVIRINDVLKG